LGTKQDILNPFTSTIILDFLGTNEHILNQFTFLENIYFGRNQENSSSIGLDQDHEETSLPSSPPCSLSPSLPTYLPTLFAISNAAIFRAKLFFLIFNLKKIMGGNGLDS